MSLLCIDIGGTSLKFALCHNGQLSQQSSFPTPSSLEKFYQLLDQEVARYSAYHFSGIAISAPERLTRKKVLLKVPAPFPTFIISLFKRLWKNVFIIVFLLKTMLIVRP